MAPYVRCVLPELRPDFRIATRSECHQSIETAYGEVIGDGGNPYDRWRFAETGSVSDLHLMGLNPQAKFVPIDEQTNDKIMHLN